MDHTDAIKITGQKLRLLASDTVLSAEAADLIYVSDREAGITRTRKGAAFAYFYRGKRITDKTILARIRNLVIPPAWEQVWICPVENGHLQATGLDARNRKQYKYHALWNTLRNRTKFSHLHDFGKALPGIRERLQKDLSLHGLPLKKILAVIVLIMQDTSMRIGSSAYERLYGSYGLTTLKDRHVRFEGNKTVFRFRGKKGVYQNITLRNRKLANIIRQCRDIPGRELFQYYDEQGNGQSIDSGMVNINSTSVSFSLGNADTSFCLSNSGERNSSR